MTQTVTSARTYSEDHLTLTNKLRKPQVENLRRDRINSSIEQLKSLLGPELLNQQPDSKLEKADILEMTVSLLSCLQPIRSSSCSAPTNQGHSRCVQEMVHFLSKEEMETHTQRRLVSHFQSLQSSSEKNRRETDLPQLRSPALYSISKEKMPINSAPWRPW